MPELASGGTWAYTAIGIGFAAVGAFCSMYAFWRYRQVEDAIGRGGFAPPDQRLVSALSILGAAIGVLLVMLLTS